MSEDSSLDFEFLNPLDDGTGPAVPRSAAALECDVRQVVEQALPSPVGRWRRVRLTWVAAAVVVPGVCAALAVARPWGPLASSVPAPPSVVPASQASATQLSRRGFGAADAVVRDKEPQQAPPSAPPRDREGTSLEGLEPTQANVEATVPVAKSPVPHSVSELAAASPSAADSLKAANKLRGKGRWSEAAQAYSRIARRYPSSAQGSVAALAAAALYLEHLGDPNTALRYYQRSLKTAGLSAEAQYGIANCYRALGNRQAEARWLDRLVKSVPGGLYSDRAQRRLRVLEGSEP